MHLSRLCGFLLLFAAGSPAAGDIFVWRDNAGISHYTTDLSNVPAEFRAEAMTVAKEWDRGTPPPEPAPVPVPVAAAPDPQSMARESYEGAFQAGYRAGERSNLGAIVNSTGSVVQNVQVEPSTRVVESVLPLSAGQERRRSRVPHRDQNDAAERFPPAERAPFLQGPAGPPPLSER